MVLNSLLPFHKERFSKSLEAVMKRLTFVTVRYENTVFLFNSIRKKKRASMTFTML